MKVISFNTRIWTRDLKSNYPYYWKHRYNAIRQMIKMEDPDVICFQELLFPTNWIPFLLGYKPAGFSITHPIFVKRGIKLSKHEFHIKFDAVNIHKKSNEIITFVNVHPRWETKEFTKVMSNINKLLKKRNNPSVVCGDFNSSLDTIKQTDVSWLKSARELLHIDESEDTFIHFAKDQHCVIDHFLLTEDSIKPITYYRISDNYGTKRMSDHFPITLDIL